MVQSILLLNNDNTHYAAQVSASRLAASDEEEMTQPSQAAGGGSATAAEAAARARGKLVSALMKRHLVEQVVPVLVELRRLLAEVRYSQTWSNLVKVDWVDFVLGIFRPVLHHCRDCRALSGR